MRRLISSLVAMLRVGQYLNAVDDELRSISELRQYQQRDKKKNDAITDYSANASKMCNLIGKDLYEAALNEFIQLTKLPEQSQMVLGTREVINEPSAVFEEIFLVSKRLIATGNVYEDDFLLWLEAAEEVLGSAEPPKKTSCLCVCGEQLERIPAKMVGESGEYVWKCPECDSYALSDENGQVVGIAADKTTHEIREKAHSAVIKLCEEKGLVEREATRYIRRNTSVSINSIQDIETLNQRECQEIVGYVLQRTIFDNTKREYPKNYKEFMKFLENGGRFRINKSLLPERNGRLIIPIMVCENSVIVKKDGKNERILMPSALKYKFLGDIICVEHPNNKETFQLFPRFEG